MYTYIYIYIHIYTDVLSTKYEMSVYKDNKKIDVKTHI